jgi:hypothetical protein
METVAEAATAPGARSSCGTLLRTAGATVTGAGRSPPPLARSLDAAGPEQELAASDSAAQSPAAAAIATTLIAPSFVRIGL